MTVKRILLPKLPTDIIDEVYKSIEVGTNQAFEGDNASYKTDQYAWIAANQIVQDWCNANISPDIYWGVQVITSDMPVHKDLGTQLKFNYIIDSGGDNVVTNFYNDNFELTSSTTCDLNTWYILDVATHHDVKNIEQGKQRVSITGRILP